MAERPISSCWDESDLRLIKDVMQSCSLTILVKIAEELTARIIQLPISTMAQRGLVHQIAKALISDQQLDIAKQLLAIDRAIEDRVTKLEKNSILNGKQRMEDIEKFYTQMKNTMNTEPKIIYVPDHKMRGIIIDVHGPRRSGKTHVSGKMCDCLAKEGLNVIVMHHRGDVMSHEDRTYIQDVARRHDVTIIDN